MGRPYRAHGRVGGTYPGALPQAGMIRAFGPETPTTKPTQPAFPTAKRAPYPRASPKRQTHIPTQHHARTPSPAPKARPISAHSLT